MKKHIAPPATAEQMERTIGATPADLEIVDRVMRELGYYEDGGSASHSSGEPSAHRVFKKRE